MIFTQNANSLFVFFVLGLTCLIKPSLAQHVLSVEDEYGNITALTFMGNAKWLVAQEAPSSRLHEMKKLKEVELVNHDMTDSEIAYISTLSNLEHLKIGDRPDFASLSARSLELIGEMENLESLTLCLRTFQEQDLAFLNGMTSLRILTIQFPIYPNLEDEIGLTDNCVNFIRRLERLEELHIDNGNFSNKFIERLGGVQSLKTLSLSSKLFNDETADALQAIEGLKSVQLYATNLSKEGVFRFGGLTNLEKLDLKSPVVFDAEVLRSLQPLSNLKELNMTDYDRIADGNGDLVATFRELAKFKKLQRLNWYGPVSDRALNELRGHPNLERFTSHGCQLTRNSVSAFESMPNLKEVYISNGYSRVEAELDAVSELVHEMLRNRNFEKGEKVPGDE